MRASEVVVTRVRHEAGLAATNEPTPHTLLSLSQRSRLATGVAADAGGRLPHRFSHSPVPVPEGYSAVGGPCLLLPSCVTTGIPVVPLLAVSQGGLVAILSGATGESGSSSGGNLQRRNTFSSQVVNVWSGRRGSNPRPSPWQGDALPTEPLPQPNRNSTKLVLACQPRATAISVQLFYALTLLRLSLGDAINSVEGKRSTILGLGNWDAEHGAAGPGWSSSAWYGLEWTVRDAAGGWKG